MKKSIRQIGISAIAALMTFASCEKQTSVMEITEQDARYSVEIEVVSAKGIREKGIVIGTKPELDAAFNSKIEKITLKKASKSNNVFVPVRGPVVDPVGPVDPVDPMALCWAEIDNYYDAHYEEWLNVANQHCQPVGVCLTCPNAGVGLFVMYQIKPTARKCFPLVAASWAEKQKLFDFDENQYDSDQVAHYIQGK